MTPQAARPLWAITSYFNPAGYQSRIANYRRFRRHLQVPLLTVEFSPDGAFDLGESDADVLVQLTDGDVMWQKERLLNTALSKLPDCSAVAWLDADVALLRDDWGERSLELLRTHALIQPFSEAYEDTTADGSHARPGAVRRSFASQHCTGLLGADEVRRWRVGTDAVPLHCGYAWVGRRDLMERHGWYDASILGGGTREFATAALGYLDELVAGRARSAAQAEHLLAWAEPFTRDVRGDIGYLPGQLAHFWHGPTQDRGYGVRYQILVDADFDPDADITARSGAWRWATSKPDLHRRVRHYFSGRNEDAAPPEALSYT